MVNFFSFSLERGKKKRKNEVQEVQLKRTSPFLWIVVLAGMLAPEFGYSGVPIHVPI